MPIKRASEILPVQPVLFTRELPKKYRKHLDEIGLQWEEAPCIQTQTVDDWSDALIAFKGVKKANVVVTSQSGARALISFLKKHPEYRLTGSYYAVGLKTRNELHKAGFLAYKPKIHDAEGLAEFMIEQAGRKQRKAIFFHGDKSLPTLPARLEEAGIEVRKVLAYHTHDVQQDLRQFEYNSVAFMSPSAIHSFAKNGGFDANRAPNYAFCIGRTTAEALKDYGVPAITLGNKQPSFEGLVRLVMGYVNRVGGYGVV